MFRRTVFLLAALPLVAGAQARTYVRDVAHSEINFIAESRLLDARGFFGAWDAQIAFDPADLPRSAVTITIDAASINTRNERRDGHLRSADFFDAETHPKITFTSKLVNAPTPGKINITGELTIRGTTKSIVVPSELVFFDAESNTGRVKGQFVIDRQTYGVAYNSSVNPIKDDVTVQFDIAFRAPAPAPAR
jgi:polyisoprenoid-binding protein YceI